MKRVCLILNTDSLSLFHSGFYLPISRCACRIHCLDQKTPMKSTLDLVMLSYLKQHFFPTLPMALNRWVTYGLMCFCSINLHLKVWLASSSSSLVYPYISIYVPQPRPMFQLSFDIWLDASICARVASGSWPQGHHAHRFAEHDAMHSNGNEETILKRLDLKHL